jgi:hypothetical protein
MIPARQPSWVETHLHNRDDKVGPSRSLIFAAEAFNAKAIAQAMNLEFIVASRITSMRQHGIRMTTKRRRH